MSKNPSKYPLNIKNVTSDDTIRPQNREDHKRVLEKIEEISGVSIYSCMQCGCCSASCPLGEEMEFAPSQIMKILQIGDFSQLEDKDAMWICASCHSCLVRCPKGIDIAKVAEAIREVFLRKRDHETDASQIPKETLRKVPQIALISCLRKFSS